MLKSAGNLAEEDMLDNLNLGVGMTLVTDPGDEDFWLAHFSARGLRAYPIGRIIADPDNTVKFISRLNWD
jgi:phosphoribosylaminoimidazole (AIR) synthetase